MKRRIIVLMLTSGLLAGALSGCSPAGMASLADQMEARYNPEREIVSFFPDSEQGAVTMLSNTAYYEGLTQRDLEYRMQQEDATLGDYEAFAAEQVQEITEEEQALISDSLARLGARFEEIGYEFPIENRVTFIKTTMAEEPGAEAYSHGSQIYLGEEVLASGLSEEETVRDAFDMVMAHELFHVLTRNDPEFRENMYRLIGFRIGEEDVAFTDEVREQLLSNPDVEHFDEYGVFTIDGEPTEAIVVSYVPEYVPDTEMLAEVRTGLVPVRQPDHIVPIDEVPDFFDVVGDNTGYVISAEECLADNFSYALIFGTEPDYPNREIIEGMLAYLHTGEETARVLGDDEEAAAARELAAVVTDEMETEIAEIRAMEEKAQAEEQASEETAAEEEEEVEEVKIPEPTMTLDEVAWDVIRGSWGNAPKRYDALRDAGYDPAVVQRRVNELYRR